MKRNLGICSLLTGLLLSAGAIHAQNQVPPRPSAYAAAPDIPFTSVPNFLKMPTGLYMGEGIGVASNSKGHFFVFTRSGRTRLFEFDKTGEFLREIGDGLYAFEMAHGVRVDAQDNIWVVDEGSNMIVEFNPQGRVIMTMGRKPEAGGGRIPATPPNGTPPPPASPHVDPAVPLIYLHL